MIDEEINHMELQITQEGDPNLRLNLLNQLVDDLQTRDLHLALRYCDMAVTTAEQIYEADKTTAENLARCLFSRTVLQIQMANYADAITSIYQALPLFTSFNDSRLHGRALNALGTANFHLGNTGEGFQFTWQALEIFEKANDQLWVAAIYGNLGYQYLHMDHYEWAERYMFQALTHLGKQESRKEYADIYDNLCMLYHRTGAYEKAIEYGAQAVELYAESMDYYGLAEAKNNLALVYQAMRNFEEAQQLHEDALTVAQKNNMHYQEINILWRLGSLQLDTDNVENSIQTLMQGLTLAEKVGARREAYRIHRVLSQAYKHLGQHGLALQHFEKFYDLQKSVLDEKETQRVKSLEVIHQLESMRKEAENLRQQSELLEKKLRDQYELQAELEMISITDPLTGLLNRRHFTTMVETELDKAAKYGKSVSMIVIDIDLFKQVNDTYGHLLGDQVLAALSDIFRQELRQRDLIWRYGGEEFVILLPHTPCEHAINVAERLREQVESHTFKIGKHDVTLTISLGVSCNLDDERLSVEALFNNADQALLIAKRQGRNQVASWINGNQAN